MLERVKLNIRQYLRDAGGKGSSREIANGTDQDLNDVEAALSLMDDVRLEHGFWYLDAGS